MRSHFYDDPFMLFAVSFCWGQTLVSERNQHMPQVDELRDTAVDLINTSGKHDEAVELQLTAFNQRWQDIDDKIKVFASSISLSFCSLWSLRSRCHILFCCVLPACDMIQGIFQRCTTPYQGRSILSTYNFWPMLETS